MLLYICKALLVASRVIAILLPVPLHVIIFLSQKCTPHFYSPSILCSSKHEPDRNGWIIFIYIKFFMEREKYIYISSIYVLVFQRKPSLHLLNRFNFLKHVQHFDDKQLIFIQLQECICELAQGKLMDVQYNIIVIKKYLFLYFVI